eukprot:2283404-Amphidinium_carterae.1
MRRPADHTIVILRSGEHADATAIDVKKLTGVAVQSQNLGMSSTQVRRDLARGVLPSWFGQEARCLLLSWQPELVLAQPATSSDEGKTADLPVGQLSAVQWTTAEQQS